MYNKSDTALYCDLSVKPRELETYTDCLKYAELECRLSLISIIYSNSIYLYKNTAYSHKFNIRRKKRGRKGRMRKRKIKDKESGILKPIFKNTLEELLYKTYVHVITLFFFLCNHCSLIKNNCQYGWHILFIIIM